jgi:hypothetical protein
MRKDTVGPIWHAEQDICPYLAAINRMGAGFPGGRIARLARQRLGWLTGGEQRSFDEARGAVDDLPSQQHSIVACTPLFLSSD